MNFEDGNRARLLLASLKVIKDAQEDPTMREQLTELAAKGYDFGPEAVRLTEDKVALAAQALVAIADLKTEGVARETIAAAVHTVILTRFYQLHPEIHGVLKLYTAEERMAEEAAREAAAQAEEAIIDG